MKDVIAKHVSPLFLSILAIFAPVQSILLVTGFLIFADLVSGVIAAKKRGEAISSAGFRRTVSKVLVYNLAVISGFLVETYMISDLLPISKLIAGVIAMVELKSILENLNSINGTDIFKTVLSSLGSKNDKIIEEAKEAIEKKEDSEEPPK